MELVVPVGGVQRGRRCTGTDCDERARHFGPVRQHDRDGVVAPDPELVEPGHGARNMAAQAGIVERLPARCADGFGPVGAVPQELTYGFRLRHQVPLEFWFQSSVAGSVRLAGCSPKRSAAGPRARVSFSLSAHRQARTISCRLPASQRIRRPRCGAPTDSVAVFGEAFHRARHNRQIHLVLRFLVPGFLLESPLIEQDRRGVVA